MSKTYCDVLFQVLLIACGVQTGVRPRIWVECVSATLSLATLASIPFGCPYIVYGTIFTPRAKPLSLSGQISVVASVTFVAISIYLIYMLVREGKRIKPLLRRSGRNFDDVVLFLICHVPCEIMLWKSSSDLGPVFTALQTFGLAKCELTILTIIMIYYDMVQNLLVRLLRLHHSTTVSKLDRDALISEKWKLRDQTSDINGLFAEVLTSFYLQVFLSAGFVWARVIQHDMNFSMAIWFVLNFFCYIFQVFRLARKASEIKLLCLKTEAELTRRLHNEATLTHLDCAFMRNLQFSDGWDSLRVGCFEHNTANFVKFLSMVSTSVAVVLQFDYLVVRAINDLSRV